MAILIKDIEFTGNCNGCKFNVPNMSWAECYLTWKNNTEYLPPNSGRPDWCPLTEVKARKMKIEYPSPISHTRTVIDKIVYCSTKDEISSRTVYNDDGIGMKIISHLENMQLAIMDIVLAIR